MEIEQGVKQICFTPHFSANKDINKFIEEKLGKKYVKYYEKLYDQCLEKYKELSLGNNKKKRILIPFLNRK